MITEKEMDEIVNLVIERVLLKMPEVLGNLMASAAERQKFKKEFYEKYPEFRGSEEVVARLYEEEASKDLTLTNEQISQRIVPKIRDRIGKLSDLDMSNVQKPQPDKLTFPENTIDESNGVL